MDKRDLQRASKPITDVYLSIEDELLKNIAKRISRGKNLLVNIDNDGQTERIESWQLSQLDQLEQLDQEQIRTIAKYSDETSEKVTEMLENAGYKSVNSIENDLKEGAERGVLRKPEDTPKNSGNLKNILSSYEDQAKDKLNLTNTTLIDQSNQQYRDVINKTTGNVLSGVQSPQQALRQSIRELSRNGVPALVDKAGRKWSTEAYVNMVMRSTSNNVANDMQDARLDEYGCDLVEVSEYVGARPGCAPYQGNIYSRSGNHDQYPALSSTSVGEPAGLFGVNCGHVKYPYFEGRKKRSSGDISKKDNEKAYEEQQQQRYLEREVRYAKREQAMLMEIGDGQGVHFAEEKVKEKQAAVREFTKQTGRTRRISREQIR